ncbi:MAG: hypothetical protein IKO17_04915 [Prevotella sp.]|nr:hypothetical protein [Prevotella sp.]
MKKYISILFAAAIAFMVSCTNDEIEVAKGVAVKVNPSGVISPFSFEINAGELESFTTNYKLRIRVLAYNDKGLLAAADTSYLTNYASIMNSTLYLSEGSYKIIAVTDVVELNNNKTIKLAFWNMTNIEDLNTVKISDNGYIGGKNKILGIASQNLTVSGKGSSITLNPEPAGALLLIYYDDIHKYSDVTEYKILTNRSCDYLTFDSYGQYVTTPENRNNTYNWRISYIKPKDSSMISYNTVYRWSFIFPINNISFKFVYSTASQTNVNITPDMTVNLKKGEEYAFILDLKDENNNNDITYNYFLINGNSSSRLYAPFNTEEKYLSVPMQSSEDDNQSRRIIDLLK